MRWTILIVAALAALSPAPSVLAQEATRPLDRIYGPPRTGETPPPNRPMAYTRSLQGPAEPGRPAAAGERPLDRIYGPGSGSGSRTGGGAAARSGGSVDNSTTPVRRSGTAGLGPSRTGQGAGVRKPAGPAYRGGTVGTRPRFSNSPSLRGPRR